MCVEELCPPGSVPSDAIGFALNGSTLEVVL